MSVSELVTEPPPLTRRATKMGLLRGLLRTARPRQWVKNVLVAAAPLAAGDFDVPTVRAIAAAFVAFCLASSAIYFLNDAFDVEGDRAHPEKRNRPIAAGVVPLKLAYVMSGLCAAAALTICLALTTISAAVVIGVYLVINIGYCLGLKHVNVLDLALVSSGFLLRALAGGVAAVIPISSWFLLVAGFGSLFMVAGKRYSEVVTLGEEAASARRSLSGYSASYLRFVWGSAAAVTLMTYCLWAFEVTNRSPLGPSDVPWEQLSIAPFALSMMMYAYIVDTGKAGKPEDVVLKSPELMIIGLVWGVLFLLGVLNV